MPKVVVNGLEMYYEIEGSGPAVVLIGGLSQDHFGWAFQVPALVAAGYRCLSFDSRDAGQTAPSPEPYGIRQFAGDTLGLMDACGIGSAHVVGLSMGGMVAQEMALARPEKVASLTLVGSAARVDGETAGIVKAWKAGRPYLAADEFVLSLSAWLFTYRFLQEPQAVAGLLEMVRGNPFPQTAAGFQRQCDAVLAHDAHDRLTAITAPTRVIVGAEDTLVPPWLSRQLAAGIAGAELTEIPAAGHALNLERPEDFNQVLLAFLNGQAPGAAHT